MTYKKVLVVLLATVLLVVMGAFAVRAIAPASVAECSGNPPITQDNENRQQSFTIQCNVPYPDQPTVTVTETGPTVTVSPSPTNPTTPTSPPTPTEPTTPTSPPTTTPTTNPPPPPSGVMWGSSVAGTSNNGSAVQTKFGEPKVYVRQFIGSTLSWPSSVPDGVLLHRSFKPPTSITNAQIDNLLLQAEGHWVTFWHEPDNDGLSASGRADRIALMNRLYDRNVALGRPVTVVPTFTGGMFADYRDEAYKQQWAGVKGDLLGVDYDGIHSYTTDYDDETDEVMDWLDQNTEYVGWAVPEFGTSRQSSDSTGNGRRAWMEEQVGYMVDAPVQPSGVAWYDYNSTPQNSIEPGTPEYNYWKSLIDTN